MQRSSAPSCILVLAAVLLLFTGQLVLAGQAPPKFTQGPTATRSGAETVIAFSVDRASDVAVYVEDDKGKVVRHLVAGALGEHPPAPLQPGLAQTIIWDGKADWNQPAGAGPFRVRVALGVNASFDSIVAEEPQNFGNIKALATGADGTLYVCCAFGGAVANWGGERIVAVNGDGTYRRTVAPFPSNVSAADAKGVGAVGIEGRTVPLVKAVIPRAFYRSEAARKSGMAVTPEGVILRPVGGYNARGSLALSALDGRGLAPWGTDVFPLLPDMKRPYFARAYVGVSSDGKFAYVSGTGEVRPDAKPKNVDFACVWRVALPPKGAMTPFFGQAEVPGSGDAQLSANVRGLASDGKGLLYVADAGNNRIVAVDEKTGAAMGTLAVEKPDGLAVDPATGALYVTHVTAKRTMELLKFSSLKDAKPVAAHTVKFEGDPQHPWVMALDAGAKPPLVWMGSDGGSLLRIEDRGTAFEAKAVTTGTFGTCSFLDLNVDRFRDEPEVYARIGAGHWVRFNEATGAIEHVKTGTAVNEGLAIQPGPDGNLYGLGYPYNFLRYNRDGKPSPWPAGGNYPDGKKGPAHGLYVPVSMVFLTHTLGIRRDGNLFVFEPGHPGGRPPKMLRAYTPEGRRVSDTPIVWKVSDTAIGPKFDQQGNIYIAEQIKPLDQPYPPEFAGVVGPVEPVKTYLGGGGQEIKDSVCTIYGSIVKFGPKGGMIHCEGENPFAGEPKLDPSLKTVEMGCYTKYRFKPTKVTGAEWVRMGISHVDLHYCNCENTRFDVDEFGRVWYPDLGRFRFAVLDTNGNELAHFGGYGTADNRGPKSADPALAQPDLAFGWLVGVGVTDRYAYLGDSLNRRLLRAKLSYAAEATVEVK
ncbi:MAG: hypothetical protein L6R28_10125 [Planctomycetes bacterium]|nr:hypothetical protein [Planctomycetota bacterium]